MYQKLQTGRATAMAELLSDTIDNVNLNNVAVSSAATPGSGGTVLVDNTLDTGAELIINGDFSATGSELVTNGDFSATGAEIVTNGDFSAKGSEVAVNGDFALNSGWGSNNTISGGQLTKTGTGLSFQEYTGFSVAKSYKCVVDVAEENGSNFTLYVGGSQFALSVGVNTLYIVNGTSNNYLGFNDGLGSIVNSISVKELGEDWNLEAGWSIEEDKATVNTVAATVLLSQSSLSVVAGKSYKISLEVSNIVAGSELQIEFSAGNIVGSVTTNGEFTFYGEWGVSSILYLYALGTSNFSVSNVTLKEVGEGWTIQQPAGQTVSFNGTQAYINYDSTATQGSTGINQTILQSGKSYKIVLDIDSLTGDAGNKLRVQAGGATIDFSDSGIKTFYLKTLNSTPFFIVRTSNGTSFEAYINSVTVKELGKGWNLNNPPFSVVSNGIASDGTSTADANQVLFPTIGKKYKIVYTIDSISSGGYKIGFGGVVSSFDTTAGTYIRYITAIDDSGYDARLRITPDNSTVGTISYVSVEEFENAGFVPIGVKVGDIVYNTASIPNVATVVGISPDGDTLTLSNDISVTSGVPYKILSRTNSAATLYLGTVGESATLKVRTAGGDDVTLNNLKQGTTIPTQVVRVYNTGTVNVSNILALF